MTPIHDYPIGVTLYLIRHGETVDNVAQIYAGTIDSALTNHGVEQARRLGQHLQTKHDKLTRVFTSPLQRALKTSEHIKDAYKSSPTQPSITVLPILIEKDFGSHEGKSYKERLIVPKKSSAGVSNNAQQQAESFTAPESKESMSQRMDEFLDRHLLPAIESAPADKPEIIAVVAHGIILTVLWRRILLRFMPRSVSIAQDLTSDHSGLSLDHLGGWSNTGFLEVLLEKDSKDTNGFADRTTTVNGVKPPLKEIVEIAAAVDAAPYKLCHWTALIKTINGKDHLLGLKRTRGGVGSSKHDEAQQSIDRFFKKRRVD